MTNQEIVNKLASQAEQNAISRMMVDLLMACKVTENNSLSYIDINRIGYLCLKKIEKQYGVKVEISKEIAKYAEGND